MHERLKAARFLSRNALADDLATLRRARQIETVSYVKANLDAAISRLSNLTEPANLDALDELDVPEELKKQIRSQSVQWIAGLLLHEIASPIGLVKRAASREIANYESSKTRRYLDNVERIFEAIEQLKGAATVAKPEPFDLAALLKDIVITEAGEERSAKVSLIGPKPLTVTADPALVRLAVSNGLRNALEATATANAQEPHPVVITWGETDVEHWVSILDRGGGIVGPPEAAFEIGKSTKKGHSGFGLAIARQAIETLGGGVVLEPASGGGARYEARWER